MEFLNMKMYISKILFVCPQKDLFILVFVVGCVTSVPSGFDADSISDSIKTWTQCCFVRRNGLIFSQNYYLPFLIYFHFYIFICPMTKLLVYNIFLKGYFLCKYNLHRLTMKGLAYINFMRRRHNKHLWSIFKYFPKFQGPCINLISGR